MSRFGLLLVAAAIASGQAFAPTGDLKFEVGTIKPGQSGEPSAGVAPAPGGRRYVGKGLPLRSYLYVAYQVKEDQIVGGPNWLDSEAFDLNAEAEKPASIEELHIMLQNFLVDRFKIQFHFEKKEMQAYTLTADKGGAKNFKPHPRTPGADFTLEQTQEQPFHAKWNAHCVSINFFTWRLSGWFDRPIINQTGMDGCFDFQLAFTQELPKGMQDGQNFNGVPIDASGPTIFQALQNQLGLKLEEKRAPVETMVIDHAERPAEE